MDPFFYPVILTGAIAGGSTGLLGVFIIGMRMPFIGTCISHAAMVGAIYAELFHVDPLWGAIVVSVIAAGSLAMIRPDKLHLDANVGMAVVFSLMLGLTFLGVGLEQDSRSEVLNLLWGSVLFAGWKTVAVTGSLAVVLAVFTLLFNKELKAILFSRSIAAATGVHEGFVYFIFLSLCGIILAVNLKTVGGLLIFSLITNPAAAAYLICRGYKSVIIASIAIGIASAVGGFLASYQLNLPTGACIVLTSTILFALAALYRITPVGRHL